MAAVELLDLVQDVRESGLIAPGVALRDDPAQRGVEPLLAGGRIGEQTGPKHVRVADPDPDEAAEPHEEVRDPGGQPLVVGRRSELLHDEDSVDQKDPRPGPVRPAREIEVHGINEEALVEPAQSGEHLHVGQDARSHRALET